MPPMPRTAGLALAGFVLFASIHTAAAAEDDPVLATVDGTEIHRSDVEAARARLPEQYRQLPPQVLEEALVQRLVDEELLRREAERRGLADDPEVKAELERARATILRAILMERIVREATTEEKLRAAYGERVKDPAAKRSEAKLRHILVQSEDEARAVIAELEHGADFAELAKQRSTGPSAAQGGDLGWVAEDRLVPEFARAAFALEPGSFTKEPVQTRFGWHVILMEERREGVPSFEEMRPELEQQLAEAALRREVEALRARTKIEMRQPSQ